MVKSDFHIAVHPGEVLKDIIQASGITQIVLARHLHLSPSVVGNLCRGERDVSPELACKLGLAFGQSPEFWMNLQIQWELSRVLRKEMTGIRRIVPIQDAA